MNNSGHCCRRYQQQGRALPTVLWLAAGMVTVLLTVMVFCPASWMALALEKQTAGRLTLGDPQGSLWRGSAFIGGAPSGNEPVTPLLPGRFVWRLSPLLLVGRVHLMLDNPAALANPVEIIGGLREWQITPSAVTLPAERLAGLGAPLNTVQPTGVMQLAWGPLLLTRSDARLDLAGNVMLNLNDMASRMSPVKPLGSYLLTMNWLGDHASVRLTTARGALVLNGSGEIRQNRLQFSGSAEAAAGQEESLANLLNLLGQRRQIGDKNVIALEFK
jgi:general secretion pathway protein N